jgi:hypothetical protein
MTGIVFGMNFWGMEVGLWGIEAGLRVWSLRKLWWVCGALSCFFFLEVDCVFIMKNRVWEFITGVGLEWF